MTPRIAAPVVFPLGIADPETELAFVSLPDHVEAIRLKDGSTAWQTADVYAPLAAANRRVLAHTPDEDPNVVALAILDARTGEVALRVAPIILREWVDIHRDTFTEHAAIIDDDFLIWWHAVRRYRGGAPPATLPAPTIDEGARRINSITGSVLTVDPPRSTPTAASSFSDAQYELQDDTIIATNSDGTRRWVRQLKQTGTPPRLRP